MVSVKDDSIERRHSTVGVIGLGAMGAPMAANLLRRPGTTVQITGRSRDKHQALVEAGARWSDTPRSLAADCDIVLLMLPDLPEVEAVLAGPDGLLAAEPAANLSETAAAEQIRLTLDFLGTQIPHLEAVARERADALLTDHRRVREAAKDVGSYDVTPCLPVDVLGVYVLLPASL